MHVIDDYAAGIGIGAEMHLDAVGLLPDEVALEDGARLLSAFYGPPHQVERTISTKASDDGRVHDHDIDECRILGASIRIDSLHARSMASNHSSSSWMLPIPTSSSSRE